MNKRQLIAAVLVWWQYLVYPAFAQTTSAPALTITPSGNNTVISWAVPPQNYVLQQSGDLSNSNWTTAPMGLNLNPTNLHIESVVSPAAGNQFFRLVLQSNAPAGAFTNLNFERATVAPTPTNGYGDVVDPAQAFPGWIISSSWAYTFVLYNDLTLGSPAVDLIGPNFPNALHILALQGSYSACLQYSGVMSQTGLVPTNAQSINFLVSSNQNAAVVELNGVSIPLVSIAGGRLAGNVSPWAGQSAQLTFTVSEPVNFLYLDDIQFSSTPVP